MSNFIRDWVRCNRCFKNFDQASGVLTSCGHFICNRSTCAVKINDGEKVVCPICHSECGAISLSDTIPPEILEFFEEPEVLLQKSIDVMKFHNHQKELARSHFEQYQTRLRQLEETIDELKAENRELHDALRKKPEDESSISSELRIPGIVGKVHDSKKKKKTEKMLIPMKQNRSNKTLTEVVPAEMNSVKAQPNSKLFTPTLASRLQNLTGKKLYSLVQKE